MIMLDYLLIVVLIVSYDNKVNDMFSGRVKSCVEKNVSLIDWGGLKSRDE